MEMKMETVIDNEFITMWFHHDSGIVHHWIPPDASQSNPRYQKAYRDALEKGVELLRTHNVRKWLSDDRNFQEQPIEDVEWGQKQWVPKAVMAGWRYWAIVMPSDNVARLSLNHLISKFKEFGITVMIFPDVESAMAWLTAI